MSYRGVEVSIDGQNHVPSAVGPMARSLGALTAATKLVVDAKLWNRDPQLPPIPWREDVYEAHSTRPLVIGTILDDGVVKVHPPIERVFRDLVTKLKAAGHEVVEWDTSLNAGCIATMVSRPPTPEARAMGPNICPMPGADHEGPGRVLCSRRRRRHPAGRRRRRRAVRAPDPGLCQPRPAHLGL